MALLIEMFGLLRDGIERCIACHRPCHGDKREDRHENQFLNS
jgi:hypothetical protein